MGAVPALLIPGLVDTQRGVCITISRHRSPSRISRLPASLSDFRPGCAVGPLQTTCWMSFAPRNVGGFKMEENKCPEDWTAQHNTLFTCLTALSFLCGVDRWQSVQKVHTMQSTVCTGTCASEISPTIFKQHSTMYLHKAKQAYD